MSKKNLQKSRGQEREQKEFQEEVLQIDRVTRVVKGGRRLRFRATVAIGDKKGRVGVGIGKASEVVTGIQKAVARAKANLIQVPITKGDTIPHPIRVKYKAAEMIILPASPGTGVIAGGALRKILHLAGIKNILSKSLGSRNTLVAAQASMKALRELRPVRERDKQVPEVKVEVKTEEKNERHQAPASQQKPVPVVAPSTSAPVTPPAQSSEPENKEENKA